MTWEDIIKRRRNPTPHGVKDRRNRKPDELFNPFKNITPREARESMKERRKKQLEDMYLKDDFLKQYLVMFSNS